MPKHFLGRSDSVEGFHDLTHTRGVYQELVFGDVPVPFRSLRWTVNMPHGAAIA